MQEEIRLRNAPSAFFVLFLNDHRMVYLRETGDAPVLHTFINTARIFIRRKYEDYIDETYRRQMEEYTRAKEAGTNAELKRPTKVALTDELPKPEVSVITLSGGDATAEYLESFEVIRSISVKLISPNADEMDGESFISSVFGEKDVLDAKDASVYFASDNGLASEPAKEYITEALKTENAEVRFKGKDKEGHQLDGDNEKVRLRVPYYEETRGDLNTGGIAKDLHKEYVDARDRKILNDENPESASPAIRQKLRQIAQNLTSLNQQSRASGKRTRPTLN